MQKLELVKQVVAATGYQQTAVEEIVNTFIFAQSRALKEGKSIFIRGFGSLNVITRKAKIGRLIKEGKPLLIPEQKTVKFIPCPRIKSAVKKLK